MDSASSDFMEPHTVYLDADERTNRILMVGYAEQLAVVEEVIGALDVVQQDLRTFKIYEIKHVDAEEVRKHLAEFDLIDEKARPGDLQLPRRCQRRRFRPRRRPPSRPASAGTARTDPRDQAEAPGVRADVEQLAADQRHARSST